MAKHALKERRNRVYVYKFLVNPTNSFLPIKSRFTLVKRSHGVNVLPLSQNSIDSYE